jgi:hypothetical protein
MIGKVEAHLQHELGSFKRKDAQDGGKHHNKEATKIS